MKRNYLIEANGLKATTNFAFKNDFSNLSSGNPTYVGLTQSQSIANQLGYQPKDYSITQNSNISKWDNIKGKVTDVTGVLYGVGGLLQQFGVLKTNPQQQTFVMTGPDGQERNYSRAEMEAMNRQYEAAQSQGSNNSQIMEMLIMMMMKEEKPEKDNTMLYVGLGVGGVVLVMMMVMMMKK